MHGGCLLTVRGPVPTKTRISRLGDVWDSYTATRLRRWLQFKHKTKRRKGGDLSTLASLWALWARTPDKSARPGVLPGAVVGGDGDNRIGRFGANDVHYPANVGVPVPQCIG